MGILYINKQIKWNKKKLNKLIEVFIFNNYFFIVTRGIELISKGIEKKTKGGWIILIGGCTSTNSKSLLLKWRPIIL